MSKVSDSPVLIRTITAEDKMKKLLTADSTVRRQDMPNYYRVNGAIYINNVAEINSATSLNDNEVPYIMSAENSISVNVKESMLLAIQAMWVLD